MSRNITVKEFFDTAVREYSVYANQRAIPSIMDGFKPSQRKSLFGVLTMSIPDTGVKIAQAAAQISLVSHYHHGEGSLEGTLVKMAQDYPGANNLNYLEPMGQFGSRLNDTPAASRYIYTKLMPSFRKLFKRVDDGVLEHLEEDGDKIEPRWYLPILPNVLINGASGMGTGFATNIMPYNPLELQAYILAHLEGIERPLVLTPWFKEFGGKVERVGDQVVITGKVERESSTKLIVTELPIGTYFDSYKQHLLNLVDEGYIKDFENKSTATSFRFELTVPRTTSYEDDAELYRKLKLVAKDKENLVVWLTNGKLKRFARPEDIVDYFVIERLKAYQRRKEIELERLARELSVAEERVRFIELYLQSSQEFSKLTKAKLEEKLKSLGFVHIDELLSLRIYNLTKDKIEELQQEVKKLKAETRYYQGSTPEKLYKKDLEELDLTAELGAKPIEVARKRSAVKVEAAPVISAQAAPVVKRNLLLEE